MSATTANTTTAAPKAKAASASKKRAQATEHPSYKDMITEAITNLKERMGSSRQAIKKYIHANYPNLTGNVDILINAAIKRGVEKNDFAQPKGPSGPIKLVKKSKSEGEKKPAVKKASKPAAKKPTAAKKASTTKKSGDNKKAAAAKKAAAPKKSGSTTAKKPATAAKKAATKKSTTSKSATTKKA
ncbi:linker histone H1 and H5 family-domain-containing protein [Syncephalis plumigaleata]|nr:linker histone H1 and H5 family-domain-containing protein [Syncephalis plumigaleata]